MRTRREQVLAVLRDTARPLSVHAIADRLDVHANTVRFHLQTLVASGQVERSPAPRTGPGRPGLLFRAHPGMDRGGPRHYRELASVLATAVGATTDAGERARAAGREWGRRLAAADDLVDPVHDPSTAVEQVVDVLRRLDFAPDPPELDATGAGTIGVRHCPFLELTADGEEVVCGVHHGLMQGVLDRLGAPVTVTGLLPFARPDLCLARLAVRPSGG